MVYYYFGATFIWRLFLGWWGGFDVGFFFSYLDEKTFSFNFVLNDVFVRYWYSL